MAAGDYGDFAIKSKAFATDITITSQDPTAPASFHSLTIIGSSHIHVDGVSVAFTPTMSTYLFSPAVQICSSNNITFTHGAVTGGDAINGVAVTATALDSTGNVQGLPTGYGFTISNSSGVVVDGVDIRHFAKGIALNSSDNVTISHNEIHDLRTSGIVGGDVSNVTIDSNHIHDSNPWRWGQTPVGDHGDFIAFWTDVNATVPSDNVHITNNLLEQGKGTAILGMWLQGDGATTFTNAVISGNAFLNGNTQGITLRGVDGASVDHNVLLQTSGDAKSAPGILLTANAHDVSVVSNITASVADVSGSTGTLANTLSGNILVQDADPTLPGFYSSDLIATLDGLKDLSQLFPTGLAGVTGDGEVAAVTKALAAEALSLTAAGPGVNLVGTYLTDRLVGSGGDDTIDGAGGADTLIGGAGNDTYYAVNQTTQIVEKAGEGVDTVIAKGDYVLQANVENLTINNTVTNGWAGTGNELNNLIIGNGGCNKLDGAAGSDTLFGGAGADTLIGGAGDDRLIGGAGKDCFRFAPGSGHDVVTDMSALDHDTIDIYAYLKLGLKPVLADVGSDVTLSFSTGETITLTGVHAANLIATSSGFTL